MSREYGTKTEYTRVIPVKDQIGPLQSDNAHRKEVLRLGYGRGWSKPKNTPGNRNPLFTRNPKDAERAQMPEGRLLTPAFKLHQQVSADLVVNKWWFQAARDAAAANRKRKAALGDIPDNARRMGALQRQMHQQTNPIKQRKPMQAHNKAQRPELTGQPRVGSFDYYQAGLSLG
jgi:hypothetical protein